MSFEDVDQLLDQEVLGFDEQFVQFALVILGKRDGAVAKEVQDG